ncbi:MAG TPA: type I restriction enzyme HsdR N-terminal domain-containing protein [Thermoanaerobaculia bacterium]|nr:type I restriction enzyme HsdR N-terminal domain-containing protein [Thermoanaerobaculia bacterium]
MVIPGKVAERLSSGLKRYQPVLESAKARDVNESDTSMIVTDIVADVFGYDKYHEITRELCIRGTFCDLATKIDSKIRMIIEVKAVGIALKDQHTKQAVDYAANEGIEWVAVTNGPEWKVYRVVFGKPIDQELVLDIDLLALNPRKDDDIESLYLLTRESIVKSALDAYHDHLQATSRFFLAAAILSDPVLDVIRRELRRLSPDVKITSDELKDTLTAQVLKREVIEGEKADQAKRKLARAASKTLRSRKEDSSADATSDEPEVGALESSAEAEPQAKS